MVLPLGRLNSVEYYNKPDNAWKDYYYAQAFPEASSLQRGGNVPFYRGPVYRMSTRESIKGNTNKQIAISSSKPKKRKHQSGELDDTIFSKSKKERN